MLKIQLLKFTDRWLGATLTRLLPRPASPLQSIGDPQSILLIRPGGIGDAVHLIPAIQALRRQFPGTTIDILAERRNAGLFDLCPGIRQLYLYDQPRQFLKVLCNRYDVVIDTEQWHRLSAVVARLIRSSIKLGYATNERARLFTRAIPYRQDDYETMSFMRLLEPFGIATGSIPNGKWLDVAADIGESLATMVPLAWNRPTVVIFPGASIVEKRWNIERFRLVAEWCLEHSLQVALVGGEAEQEAGERIASGLSVVNLIGRTTLIQTAAVIEQAALVLSGDSGVLHIAVGLGRPTVALFGPGSVLKWAPRGPGHIVLHRDLPCSPCTRFGTTPPCPHDIRCMREITVDEVTRAIEAVMYGA